MKEPADWFENFPTFWETVFEQLDDALTNFKTIDMSLFKTHFEKDAAEKRMVITREFSADQDRVWEAWTNSEQLDQWWAPKPWKARTEHMDFSEGGYWLYVMEGPEGERHWSRSDYTSIQPKTSYRAVDFFCDEAGRKNDDMGPPLNWHVAFAASEHGTTVHVRIEAGSAEDLDKILEMGFREGFTAAHENLDELLKEKA